MSNKCVLLLGFVLLLSCVEYPAQDLPSSSIETIAGAEAAGVAGTDFSLNSIAGLANDAVGNTYFTIQALNRVYRLGVDGQVTVYAGNGVRDQHKDGVPATSSPLLSPGALAVDSSGNLLIRDWRTLLRVDAGTGILATIFTTPYTQPGSANTIGDIGGMVVGPDGTLYLTDGARIESYSFASGSVTVLAGNGVLGPTRTGVSPTSSPLKYPITLAVAVDGTLYFSTMEPAIFYVQPDGRLGSLNIQPDRGGPPLGEYDIPSQIALDGLGHLFVTQGNRSRILRISLKTGQALVYAGTGNQRFNGDSIDASRANITAPTDLTSDAAGNLTFAEMNRVRRVDAATKLITTIVGNGLPAADDATTPALRAKLSEPAYAVPAPDGSVYITSSFGHRLLRLGPDGRMTTVAGGGDWVSHSSDPGPALEVALNYPQGVWIDDDGDPYFSDQSNRIVRRLALQTGAVTNLATSPRKGSSFGGILSHAAALVADQDFFYLSDPDDDRVWRISKRDGAFESYAGLGSDLFHSRVPGLSTARLTAPSGLALDVSRNLYISDGRELGKQGRILRVNAADGRLITILSDLQHPASLAFQSPTVLCFSESGANQVRCLDLTTHKTRVVAGSGIAGFGGDGGPAECAQLNRPLGISFDQTGSLYIADTGNQRIRRVHLGQRTGQCPK